MFSLARLLLPVDFSDRSAGAARYARALARRFGSEITLLHVLPPRFVKIRHYGLMAPRNAKAKLEQARALIYLQEPDATDDLTRQKLDTPSETKTWQEMLQALTGIDRMACPNCGQGKLIRRRLSGSEAILAPPIWDSS